MTATPRHAPFQTPTCTRPADADVMAELARLERLAFRMDSLFRVPQTDIRVGLDALLGLIPGIGDAASALPSIHILYRAHRMQVPRGLLARMALNAGLDWLLGSIPILGDLFDIGFKANLRNVALLRRHVERRAAPERQGPPRSGAAPSD